MTIDIVTKKAFHDCWNQIGVTGDRTCPELITHIHCRNCPIYSAAGRGLLEREAPTGYLQEWTDLLSQNQEAKQDEQSVTTSQKQDIASISVIIFRLGVEWLALPANLFKEVTQPSPIHTIPHRSNKILLGIVSIRGEILMCVSLRNLLGLEAVKTHHHGLPAITAESLVHASQHQLLQSFKLPETADLLTPPEEKLITLNKQDISPVVYERMVVVEVEDHKWVFNVDEIYSIKRFSALELKEAPAVIKKSAESFTKAVINWQGKKVNYLDHELLFYNLNRKIS